MPDLAGLSWDDLQLVSADRRNLLEKVYCHPRTTEIPAFVVEMVSEWAREPIPHRCALVEGMRVELAKLEQIRRQS